MGRIFRILFGVAATVLGLVLAYFGGAVAFFLLLIGLHDLQRRDAGDLARRVPVGSTVEQVEHLVGRPPDRRTGDAIPWDGNLSSMPDDVAVRGRFTHQWVVGRGRLIVRFDHHAVTYAYGVAEPPFVGDQPVLRALSSFFFWWMPASD